MITSEANSFSITGIEEPIKPGKYEVVLKSHRLWIFNGRQPKLTMSFGIVSMGEYFERKVDKHYNVNRIKGKQFKTTRGQEFTIDFVRLFPDRFRRLDRLPMEPFYTCILLADVKMVTRNHKQQAIPEPLQYPVITKLIKIVSGGGQYT